MERTASEVRRIITLSSGYSRGSNLLAIHHYFADAKLPVCIQNAIFSSTKAPAILACEAEGIPATVIPAKDMTFFEYAVLKIIRDQQIELVALCGFMKLLSQEFINTCGIPILNIHPALLPRFGGAGMYGMKVHEAVFASSESHSGATVHLVDPQYDHGKIIAQSRVALSGLSNASEIAACVLRAEHYLYPRAIERYLLHPQARIAIGTLGCKTNFFESASIFESFKDAVAVDFDSEADIYIINSCTVTNRADYKSRNLIRKALAKKELNPLIKIVVTGCFAQRSKEEIAALGDIDCIVDNQNKLDIAQILQGHERAWQDIMEAEDFVYRPVTNMLSHTRAFHKIQDGCDFYCAYCAVPYGRGHSRSAKFEDVIAQAELFCQSGFKEIVLGGVNLGLYRDQGRDLVDVVKAMSEIEELKLIRISSIEPQLLYPKMFAGLKDIPKLCPHFHIPLQSASDTILQRMGRHYDTALIKNLTSDILRAFPDAAIGFDVITGFPTESEELFEEGLNFLKSMPIAYLHVFSYSRRKGTKADTMPQQVPNKEKTRRAGILTALSTQKKQDYQKLLMRLNPDLCGVVEAGNEVLSDHFLRIRVPHNASIGEYISVKATEVEYC